jgi:DNA-binding transcriptional MerR regulator
MSCEQPLLLVSGSNADVAWADDLPNSLLPPETDIEYTVGELAAELGITPRALRFYESKGLLSPARHEGMRLYRRADRERLALILKAKKFGFTLLEIREIIAAQSGQRDGQSLNLGLAKCTDQIAVLERQRTEIDEALAELREMQCTLIKRGNGR